MKIYIAVLRSEPVFETVLQTTLVYLEIKHLLK